MDCIQASLRFNRLIGYGFLYLRNRIFVVANICYPNSFLMIDENEVKEK